MTDLKIALFIIGALLMIDAAQADNAKSGAFAVIVNAENPLVGSNGDVTATIRRLYLKQQKDWPSGSSAIVFARPADTAEEAAFRRYILKMDDNRLDSHWLRMKQTQGVAPPRAVGSTRILLRQINQRENAVGIVRLSELGDVDGVKILLKFGGTRDD